jgi:hypothetical protein
MQLVALSSLAEVGIGLNLAFGTIRHVRKWLGVVLTSDIEQCVTRLAGILSAYPQYKKPVILAKAFDAWFRRWAPWVERASMVLALASAVGLLYLLVLIARDGGVRCSPMAACYVATMVTGPILFAWVTIGGMYLFARGVLEVTVRRYESLIGKIKELEQSINPTDPD